ncbi:pirin family protein [Gordonia sinesedis]
MTAPDTRVIRAADRHHWSNEWLDSRQSFPATGNFDLRATAHGVLLVHNDDRVDSGEGLDMHQHRDAEIVTWVVDGALAHRDSDGNSGTLHAGTVQVMSAGRGIRHAERNAATRASRSTLRVIQMWVAPEYPGGQPTYAERDVAGELAGGALVPLASGLPRHADSPALPLANRFAALYAARLPAGGTVTLPPAKFGHLFVVTGDVEVSASGPDVAAYRLTEGDALRTVDAGELSVAADRPAEVLFWEMHAGFSAFS